MFKLKKLIILFSLIFFISGIFLLFFIRRQYVAPILMYHAVNPKPIAGRALTVSVKTFERQMHFLKAHRYNVITLAELAGLIKNKKNIPARTVVITFDDGYKDNFLYAFPLLKKYNLCATIFIITNEVGRPQNDRLSWDEIKIMQDSGLVEFGSHTQGPEPLINIKSQQAVKNEIFVSKRILENKLERPVGSFSYPEGRFNDKIRQLVIDAGYKAAVATSPGRKYPKDDIYALKRLRISETTKNMFVFWIETSGFYTFIKEHRDSD